MQLWFDNGFEKRTEKKFEVSLVERPTESAADNEAGINTLNHDAQNLKNCMDLPWRLQRNSRTAHEKRLQEAQ